MNVVEKKILEILQRNTNRSDLTEKTFTSMSFNQLNVNSLNFIKIIVELEDVFDIEFDDDQINYEMLNNISDLVILIHSYLDNRSEGELG